MTPVVLAHGIFGFAAAKLGRLEYRYFGEIERAIQQRGHPVLVPSVHPIASIETRAQQLQKQILDWLRDIGRASERVLIIAHSMGGLDSRYMIARLGMSRRVAALLTVATPHRGSPQADFWVANPAVRHVGIPVLRMLGLQCDGAQDLTGESCRRFNEKVPDAPGVRYCSISTACPAVHVPIVLQPGYWQIRLKEGDNDGLVSVKSATWGEHLTTWPVHHLHAVNRRFPGDLLNPVKSIAPLYLDALDRLPAAGLQ
jgi:triacylglycerol lipase